MLFGESIHRDYFRLIFLSGDSYPHQSLLAMSFRDYKFFSLEIQYSLGFLLPGDSPRRSFLSGNSLFPTTLQQLKSLLYDDHLSLAFLRTGFILLETAQTHTYL